MKDYVLVLVFERVCFEFLFRHIGCISDHSLSIVFVQHSVDVLSKPLLLYLAYWPGVLCFVSRISTEYSFGCSCVETELG